ncbi:MAG: helix-turn-helix domain-containing protein [Burkholderiales bacterium]
MSRAIRFVKGQFGRAALLEMNAPLVTHAHHHCHVLIKAGGADALFQVQGIPCPLTDGHAVLVNAWEPHAYMHQQHAAATTEILALYIEPEWLGAAGPCGDRGGRLFTQPVVALTPRALRLALDLMHSLRDQAEGIARFETQLAELMISVIAPFFSANRTPRFHARSVAAHAPQDGRIRRAMTIMQENVGTGMDMGVVAARCGLSRAHFFELFRRTTSITPAIYSNELRMEVAFNQLACSSDPVASVAGRLGFSAPGHFTRFFLGHIGVTPRAYRQSVNSDAPASHSRISR